MFERFQKFRSKKLWVNIICLSTVTQSLRIFVHFFCGIAVGVTLSMSWYFYYIPLVAIVSALPISIGGFGPREFLAQSLFARAGVPGLESVVIQLLAYFVSLILSLFGAVVFLMGQKPVTSTPEQTNGHAGGMPSAGDISRDEVGSVASAEGLGNVTDGTENATDGVSEEMLRNAFARKLAD